MIFKNRAEAGKELAEHLIEYGGKNTSILAIPRGGIVVGSQISTLLKIPLSVIIVRKIGHPRQKELAIGAISEKGIKILSNESINRWRVGKKEVAKIIKEDREELSRRVKAYRKGKKLGGLAGQKVILVDDGIATGATVKAAILSIKKLNPQKIILATPVCSSSVAEELKTLVDDFICIVEPSELSSIGSFYQDFSPVEDSQVLKFLRLSKTTKAPDSQFH